MDHYRIGKAIIKPQSNEVVKSGKSTYIDEQVMRVLVYLIDHQHRVVSREELFANLWHGVVVSDDALNRCIYLLRKALDEPHQSGTAIRTIRKKGYRLMIRPATYPTTFTRRLRPLARAATYALTVIGGVCILFLCFCLIVAE